MFLGKVPRTTINCLCDSTGDRRCIGLRSLRWFNAWICNNIVCLNLWHRSGMKPLRCLRCDFPCCKQAPLFYFCTPSIPNLVNGFKTRKFGLGLGLPNPILSLYLIAPWRPKYWWFLRFNIFGLAWNKAEIIFAIRAVAVAATWMSGEGERKRRGFVFSGTWRDTAVLLIGSGHPIKRLGSLHPAAFPLQTRGKSPSLQLVSSFFFHQRNVNENTGLTTKNRRTFKLSQISSHLRFPKE